VSALSRTINLYSVYEQYDTNLTQANRILSAAPFGAVARYSLGPLLAGQRLWPMRYQFTFSHPEHVFDKARRDSVLNDLVAIHAVG
jgi:hypothetical protein